MRFLFVVGIALALWGAVTYWGSGEPVTGALQERKQNSLKRDPHACVPRSFALGLLTIPKLGVEQVVVQGTSTENLKAGPGHYPETGLPGSGRTIAIAGHRTTWGAPFRHLDELEAGDLITFCGARYRVTRVRVVDDEDWSVIRQPRTVETLLLTACHPLYSADQRLIAVAERVPGHLSPTRKLP